MPTLNDVKRKATQPNDEPYPDLPYVETKSAPTDWNPGGGYIRDYPTQSKPKSRYLPRPEGIEDFKAPNYSNRNEFRKFVAQEIGGDPFLIDPYEEVEKSDINLPQLFNREFKGYMVWSDRERMNKHQKEYWDDFVKKYHATIFAKATAKKENNIDQMKWMMGNFDKKQEAYNKRLAEIRAVVKEETKGLAAKSEKAAKDKGAALKQITELTDYISRLEASKSETEDPKQIAQINSTIDSAQAELDHWKGLIPGGEVVKGGPLSEGFGQPDLSISTHKSSAAPPARSIQPAASTIAPTKQQAGGAKPVLSEEQKAQYRKKMEAIGRKYPNLTAQELVEKLKEEERSGQIEAETPAETPEDYLRRRRNVKAGEFVSEAIGGAGKSISRFRSRNQLNK